QEAAHQLVQGRPVVEVAALRGRLDLADDGEQTLGVAIQQVKQDPFLALVVVIEPRLGRAAGRGDVVHAGRRVAAVGEALGGYVQDLIAFEFVLGRLGPRHALDYGRSQRGAWAAAQAPSSAHAPWARQA